MQKKINSIINNVEKVIIGKTRVVKLALAAMLAEGHIIFEDVPGVGKTILARSLARSIGCSFKRIQFTPDLLPSDVTGVSIYNQKTNEFEFKAGPILSQIVLADEINRATPRTQSSLLESMAENQITVEGVTREMAKPFIVMATQNPVEFDGTFPLPEAQLDRFLIRLKIDYPEFEDEVNILKSVQYQHPVTTLEPVISDSKFVELQQDIKDIHVEDKVSRYIVEIVKATRKHSDIELGASPRGSIGLFKMSQAWAAVDGRDYVIPDDIKDVFHNVLDHRLIIRSDSQLRGIKVTNITDKIIKKIDIPVGV